MPRKPEECKCKHCGDSFIPDRRNVGRQEYCGKDLCRKASKAASQKRWLEKPENCDYFKGPENIERVRQWRKKNPGYGRKKRPPAPEALQEGLNENAPLNQPVKEASENALQDAFPDALSGQDAVLIGLIAQLTGYALQDEIACTIRLLRNLGQDILNASQQTKGAKHAEQKPHLPGARPTDSQTVQLGGSPAGP